MLILARTQLCLRGQNQAKTSLFQLENRLQFIHPHLLETLIQVCHHRLEQTHPSVWLNLLTYAGLPSDTHSGITGTSLAVSFLLLICAVAAGGIQASSSSLRAASNANVHVNNHPAMVLVRRKALLEGRCVPSWWGGGERKGFLSIGRMGHLAEENSISVGFCGGFYCHMGCGGASEGLYGLPRKISGAGCGGNPAAVKGGGSSGLHKRTSNKLLSVTALLLQTRFLLSRYSSFHSVFYSFLQHCGSGPEAGHTAHEGVKSPVGRFSHRGILSKCGCEVFICCFWHLFIFRQRQYVMY